MEFKITKSDFINSLNQIQSVVERKNVMPILANVLLEAEEGILKLTATDLEVALHLKTPIETIQTGKITVLAKKLYDIIKEAAGDQIVFRLENADRIQIQSLNNTCKIMALSAHEYPKLPEPEGSFSAVESEDLLDLLDKVMFAISTDETRYHMNGIYFVQKENGMVAVATDGHRLALKQKSMQIPGVTEAGFIMPRKGVSEIRKILQNNKKIEWSVNKKNIFVRTEKQTLFIRLIDGEFPNYSRVIPEKTKIQVEIPREDFAGALRRVSLLSDEYSKGVRVAFANNMMIVTTTNHDVGESKEEIMVRYNDEPIEISFNSKYLADVCSALSDDTIILCMNDKSTPCKILSQKDPQFLGIVMPMRS